MTEDTSLREKALRDELAAHKAKSIARGKLLERFRCHLQEVVDHVSDEGDRAYFGSTNHFTYLKDIVNEMDMWNWDAIIRERPEVDPYAEMRTLRTASEAKDRRIEALEAENERYRSALEDVVSPLNNLRREAEAKGCQINGAAYSISNDLGFVQGIARAALSGKERQS